MASEDPGTEAKYQRARAVLSAAYERARKTEPVHNGRPFHALVPEAQQAVEEGVDDEFEQRKEHWRAFIAFIFVDGPRPDRVLKRLYAIAWATNRNVLLGMNMREVGDLLGEVRATVSNRVNDKFSDYLARWGFSGTRAIGQKAEETRDMYADLARGNTSRRDGKRKGDAPRER